MKAIRIRSLVSVASVLVLVQPTPSSAAPAELWLGLTEQGLPIEFAVSRGEGSRTLHPRQFQFDVTCELSGESLEVVLGFLGTDVEVVAGTFAFDFLDLQNAFHISGAFRNNDAQGVIEYSFPAFTPKEELQGCGSGVLAWRASSSDLVATPAEAARVRMIISTEGGVVRTTASWP